MDHDPAVPQITATALEAVSFAHLTLPLPTSTPSTPPSTPQTRQLYQAIQSLVHHLRLSLSPPHNHLTRVLRSLLPVVISSPLLRRLLAIYDVLPPLLLAATTKHPEALILSLLIIRPLLKDSVALSRFALADGPAQLIRLLLPSSLSLSHTTTPASSPIPHLCHTLADATDSLPPECTVPLTELDSMQAYYHVLSSGDGATTVEAVLRLLTTILLKTDCRDALRHSSILQAAVPTLRVTPAMTLRFLHALLSCRNPYEHPSPKAPQTQVQDAATFGSIAGGMGLDLVLRSARSRDIPTEVISLLPSILKGVCTHEGNTHRLILIGMPATLVSIIPRLSPPAIADALSLLSRSFSPQCTVSTLSSCRQVAPAAADCILHTLSSQRSNKQVQSAGLEALAVIFNVVVEVALSMGQGAANAAHEAVTEHATDARVMEACAKVFLAVSPVDIVTAACGFSELTTLLNTRRTTLLENGETCIYLSEAIKGLEIVSHEVGVSLRGNISRKDNISGSEGGTDERSEVASKSRFAAMIPGRSPRSRSGGTAQASPTGTENGIGSADYRASMRRSFGGVGIGFSGSSGRNSGSNGFRRKRMSSNFGMSTVVNGMINSGDSVWTPHVSPGGEGGRAGNNRRVRSDFVRRDDDLFKTDRDDNNNDQLVENVPKAHEKAVPSGRFGSRMRWHRSKKKDEAGRSNSRKSDDLEPGDLFRPSRRLFRRKSENFGFAPREHGGDRETKSSDFSRDGSMRVAQAAVAIMSQPLHKALTLANQRERKKHEALQEEERESQMLNERQQKSFRHVPWVEARLMRKSSNEINSNEGKGNIPKQVNGAILAYNSSSRLTKQKELDNHNSSSTIGRRTWKPSMPSTTDERGMIHFSQTKSGVAAYVRKRSSTLMDARAKPPVHSLSPLSNRRNDMVIESRRPSLPPYIPVIPNDDDEEEDDDDFSSEYQEDVEVDKNEAQNQEPTQEDTNAKIKKEVSGKTWSVKEDEIIKMDSGAGFEKEATMQGTWEAGNSGRLALEPVEYDGQDVDKLLDAEEENETEEDINRRYAACEVDMSAFVEKHVGALMTKKSVNGNPNVLEIRRQDVEKQDRQHGLMRSNVSNRENMDSSDIEAVDVDILNKFGERERKRVVEVTTARNNWVRPNWSIWPTSVEEGTGTDSRSYPKFHPRVESGSLVTVRR